MALDISPRVDRGIQRNLVGFVLDTSGSMNESTGTESRLEGATAMLVRALKEELPRIGPIFARGEIAVGSFHGSTSGPVLQWADLGSDCSLKPNLPNPFTLLSQSKSNLSFTASGTTPLADAIVWAGESVIARIEALRSEKRSLQYKPTIFLLSDGLPSPGQDMGRAAAFLQKYAFGADYKFLFLFLATHGADSTIAAQLGLPEGSFVPLEGASMGEILEFVTATLTVVTGGDNSLAAGPDAVPADYRRVKKLRDARLWASRLGD